MHLDVLDVGGATHGCYRVHVAQKRVEVGVIDDTARVALEVDNVSAIDKWGREWKKVNGSQ